MLSRPGWRLLIAVGLASFSLGSAAEQWNVIRESSAVNFVATQQGVPFQGRFESFSAEIDFDPAEPESGRMVSVIEPGSVNSADSERDTTLLDRDWFDPRNHPEARFASQRIEATADGFRAHGELTLRGVTKPVIMDFIFETMQAGGATQGRLSGTVNLRRLDFGVGQGFWSDTTWVADEVTIEVELTLEQ